MAAAKDLPTKKDGSYRCIFPRHLVRIRHFTIKFYSTDSRDRVCVVSIIRVVIAAQFNINDFTYGIAKANIVTGLEPCIGLIAACLPMFPPTFRRIRGDKESLDSRDYVSSRMARLRSMDSKKSAFRTIDDLYPLTDLEERGIQNHVAGPDSMSDSLVDD